MRLPEKLPELGGRWLTAYKLLWWSMLAASLVALTIGQWSHFQSSSRIDGQLYNAGLLPNEEGDELTFSPLGPVAETAGIAPDSVLLAVDGRAVSTSLATDNLARIAHEVDGRAGQAVTLRLRAPNGKVADARVVRGPEYLAAADREAPVTREHRRVITLAAEILDALIVLAGAILLFWRRPSDPVAALLSLGLLAVPANGIAYLIPDMALRRMVDSGLDGVPMVCILLGMTVFPSGRFRPRWSF